MCSLFPPLQVALIHSGSAEGEEIKRNMNPLWFPESLEKQSGWMLAIHVILAVILGVAESN